MALNDSMENPLTRNILFLTGRPGIGKTTVRRRIAAFLTGWRLAGFYTQEIRETGQRQEFRVVTFEGVQKIMAHSRIHSPCRVGKYGVDASVIAGFRYATTSFFIPRPGRGVWPPRLFAPQG